MAEITIVVVGSFTCTVIGGWGTCERPTHHSCLILVNSKCSVQPADATQQVTTDTKTDKHSKISGKAWLSAGKDRRIQGTEYGANNQG